ncbi:MAG: hypothetical protein A2W19_06985 [Spirochaetes bacterium RBG_16_49_21]|nr:MAG: hypothetical protein A2W19_06985 [Spirochaetes bacterium RBG_16_49_21]
MLFNSIEFIIFFSIVAVIYYRIPYKWRWAWLLACGFWFYMSFAPWFILPLLSVILIEYLAARLIEQKENRSISARIFLAVGITYPLILLIIFKYLPFFNDAVAQTARLLHLNYPQKIVNLIIPVGISYYALQSISYVIEVYRGSQKAERHFGIYALHISFFPKIIAGPIERPNLIKQFLRKRPPDYRDITDGLRLMAFGFFKKLVIADRIGIAVNEVYNHPYDYHGIYHILATAFFSVQLYCDFSGYSDIAKGAARVLGLRLMDNFKRPYGARSIREFWRRWHISLTTWLRDYWYIPLGGNRVAGWRWQYNLFITFLASGLWHGASWTFVAWGVLHGLYVLAGVWSIRVRSNLVHRIGLYRLPRLYRGLQVSVTCILVGFAWIFFRADTLSDALYMARQVFTGAGDFLSMLFADDAAGLRALFNIARDNTILGFSRETYRPEMLIALVSIISLGIISTVQERTNAGEALLKKGAFVRWSLYYLLASAVLFFGMFTKEQFIYFRF